MKHILMIATGGTIASKETADGLAPQLTSEELLAEVPELEQLCRIDTVQLMNRDSTNINSRDWLQMAACVREHYDAYDGFVLTHGTDTMAYTAAALSYLFRTTPSPVGHHRLAEVDLQPGHRRAREPARRLSLCLR